MKILAHKSIIYIGNNLLTTLKNKLESLSKTSTLIWVCDSNTKKNCLPILERNDIYKSKTSLLYEITSGEEGKSFESMQLLMQFLIDYKINRNAVLIALGGGVVTDLCGFVASTYKRGINLIHIPTTIIGMADAAVGGKNGINANGIKNIIGNFYDPLYVFIIPDLSLTLPKKEKNSGKAEILKTLLLQKNEILPQFLNNSLQFRNKLLTEVLLIKAHFINTDYYDKKERNALNLGHTIGHAIESFYNSTLNTPILHGQAVAAGLMVELRLSEFKFKEKQNNYQPIYKYISSHFNKLELKKEQYPILLQYMLHDKKNIDQRITFTLLKSFGNPVVKQFCTQDEISEALNFYVSYNE